MTEKVYRIMLASGILGWMFVFYRRYFTWGAFLQGAPIATVLAGSYFWIRSAIWKPDKTIDDNRMAFILLVAAAVAEFFRLRWPSEPIIFVCILFVVVPVSNWIVRSSKKNSTQE